MKRFFFSLLALAALVAVPSCMKEPVSSPDPALGGSPVEVSFQVDLNNVLTKADNNSALDDASGTWNLYVAAFSTADGSLISTSKIGGTGYEPVETLSGSTQKTVTLTLAKGASYKVVFFAEKAGAYNVSFADNKVAKFSYQSGLLANSAGLDAFFATVDVSSSTTVYSVTLKRPFAQVNVLVPLTAVPTGQTSFSSAMKVKAPTTFDLFAGAATGDASVVEFSNSAIAASPWGQYATTHKWVGMNYVLVPSDGMVEVTYFKESGMPVAIAPGKVPAKMNGRTNLVGNIYDLSAEFSFTVQIGSGFESQGEEPVIADETVITFADNSTYTTQNPLTIDASAAATPQNVTLRVNGHTFTEVLAGAAQGATITATSANPAVASAAVSNNDVVITPVGNGQTVITVTTPSYTKADYRGTSFEIPVKVEGMSGGGGGQGGGSDTIVFADLNLENGKQYTTPFTQGDMSVTFAGGNNDGKYYTTGTGIRTYGNGTITVASSKNIVKIEFTFDTTETKDGDNTVTYLPNEATFESVNPGSYDLTTQTWTGSATSVVLTRKTGTGHWRLQKVKVYYEGGGDSGGSGGSGEQGGGGGQTTGDKGTQSNPYTVAEALAATNALDPKGETADKVYIRGKISEITSVDTGDFGNATYYISDDGSKTGQFQVFRGYYLGGAKFTAADQIKVGDNVIVYGKLKNYQNSDNSLTPEVTSSQLYSLNGQVADSGSGQGGQGGQGSGEQGGGNVDTSDANAKLTNAEIQTATVDATITSDNPSYRDGTITSTSGTWTGNFAKHANGVKYLQLRNKKGAYIKSPEFPSNIQKIVITMTSDANVTLADRALHAIPPGTAIPTGEDVYANTLWATEYGSGQTGSTKGAKVTIEFTGQTKQFTLVVQGGATYIDEIAVYY